MSYFLFALNAVSPMFIMVVAGMLLKRFLRPTVEQTRLLSKICFTVLIPCALFKSSYSYNLSNLTNGWLYLYGAATFIVAALVMMPIGAKCIPDNRRAGAFVHSAVRPNALLLGIPLAINLLGEEASMPCVLMSVLMAPLFNILGVVILTYFSGSGEKVRPLSMLKAIFSNPILIGILIGFAFSAFSIPLPTMVSSAVNSLGASATPLAMIAIGMGFDARHLKTDRALVCAASAIKLIVLPAVFTVVAYLIGFRSIPLFAVFLIHAVPTAANSGVITASMGCDGEVAGEIVLVTTLASLVTLILGIVLMQALHVI